MRTINFATIGTNYIVDEFLAGASHEPRFRYEALYSRSAEKGALFAAKHSCPKLYTALEEMAVDVAIDAVYVASPNSLHYAHTMLMLRSGKHVICEKPFASNACEAREMVDEARKRGLMLMEAVRTTHSPNFKLIMETLPRLGTLHHYFGTYCQHASDYDRCMAGEVPNGYNPALSNCALVDIAIYPLYPMIMLWGVPQNVQARAQLLHTGVDIAGSIIADYEQMNATIIYSKATDSTQCSEIQGEHGSILFSKANIIDSVHLVERDGTQIDLTRPYIKDDMYYEIHNFIDDIESGAKQNGINTHAVTLQTMELMDRIRQITNSHFCND